MAIHLTPTELAREAGMERREVIEKCMEMGVPIFQGRIDKTLFLANLRRAGRDHERAGSRSLSRPRRPSARRARRIASSTSGGGAAMEAARPPRRPRSTGSTTIADMMGLAAERYGERPAARATSATASGATSPTRELGEIVSEIAPRPDRPRPRARRPRRAAVHAPAPSGRTSTSRITSAGGVVVPDLPDELARGVRVGGRQLRVARSSSARTPRRWPRSSPSATELPALEAIVVDRAGRRRGRRDLARRAARARPRPRRGRARARAPRPSRPRTRTRSSTRPARPARRRAACSRTATTARCVSMCEEIGVDRGRRRRLPLPAARALLRAADPAAGGRPRRADRLLRAATRSRSCPS